MKPTASLSLDLDNDWSYRKVRGLADWEQYPSYLDVVVPRAIDFLAKLDQPITFFVVGRDALGDDARWIKELAAAGHEIGNHSFDHRPWMDRDTPEEIDAELARAEDAIGEATGRRPDGYRGPGYSLSPALLQVLTDRGYLYDASTLPTWIGPLARTAYFRAAKFSREEREVRRDLYGHLDDTLRPLHPYRWETADASIIELPVSTLPVGRLPIHFSYLLALGAINERLSRAYWAAALKLAAVRRIELSMLLHPLDLVDAEEIPQLAFFPGMAMPSAVKLRLLSDWIRMLHERFEVVTTGEHARRASLRPLPVKSAQASNRRVGKAPAARS